MVRLVLALIPIALIVSLVGTFIARALGRKLNTMDGAGVAGQVKAAPRKVPNIGGLGIFLGFALPLTALLLALTGVQAQQNTPSIIPADLVEHLRGLASKTSSAWILLAGAFLLHIIGLIDDRKPLGALPKLLIMIAVATLATWLTDTRMFTMLDAHTGGSWASIALTVLWIVVVTNAMNFLDNMDGLSAGVGAIASMSFLAISLLQGQWFIAGCFALLAGSLLGFLAFNRPPASIFMGDGGSLVLGFLLAFLSVRITYTQSDNGWTFYTPYSTTSGEGTGELFAWYATLTPLVVLAIPLYDLTSVVILRLSQGKSPFVGDLQHFSHRFVERGLSKPIAVAVIWGFAGVTGLAGILLTHTRAVGAIIIATMVALLLIVLAVIEFGGNRPTSKRTESTTGGTP
ncbi:MAG: MraY family glycosyltransferase [Phycisphaerales bacterium]